MCTLIGNYIFAQSELVLGNDMALLSAIGLSPTYIRRKICSLYGAHIHQDNFSIYK